MKPLFTSLSFLFIFSLSVKAQQKLFTMQDAVVNQHTTLAPKRLDQLQWVKNTDQYSYVKQMGDGEALMVGPAPGTDLPKEYSAVTLAVLNNDLHLLNRDSLRNFPQIEWQNAKQFRFNRNNNIFEYDLKEKQLKLMDSLALPADAENLDQAPGNGAIAFTEDNNLYVLDHNKVIPISESKDKNIVSGQVVSRFEFGITKGTFWSPDGKKLAYYVKDESDVFDYPIIDWTVRPAKAKNIKYPMAGSSSEKLKLKVYNFETGETITMKTGEPEVQYLTNIAWSPDSRMVYIAHLNRDQNDMKLKRYDSETGELDKMLFEETSAKYVEPLQPIHFVKGHSDEFIWESSRSGFNHLYLYNIDGKLVRQLTKGDWVVTEFQGYDQEGKRAFFTSTATSPLNRDLYSVELKNGKMKRLSENKGTHLTVMNDDGKFFIDNFSSTTVPWQTHICSTSSSASTELLNAVNPLSDYKLGKMRIFTLKGDDGSDLYCRMYYPVDFDSTKKYPVVVYLYGGPHAQMIRNYWDGGGNLWFQYMAQHGYIVWTLDNRGSSGRGQAWEQQIFRHLGTVEMEDQITGVNFLKSKSYVDTNRMGIHGWSFGGFMTISMMTRHPGIFKVAVAGGPVIDWSYYEVMYTERYMDTPQQNPEGYKNNNLLNYIDNLKGKLLVIQGTSDDIVVWQHTQMYLKKAIEMNKQLDYFVYPMHGHNVRGQDRVHLMQKITDYFNDFL